MKILSILTIFSCLCQCVCPVTHYTHITYGGNTVSRQHLQTIEKQQKVRDFDNMCYNS